MRRIAVRSPFGSAFPSTVLTSIDAYQNGLRRLASASYQKPFSKDDHDAITQNMLLMGVISSDQVDLHMHMHMINGAVHCSASKRSQVTSFFNFDGTLSILSTLISI